MAGPVHYGGPDDHRRRCDHGGTGISYPTRSASLLGRGTGADQMQAHLHFSGDYGHRHYDNLNLILWGKEREMLPDVGYSMTQLRYWTMCTLGHNLVVVDRRDQVGPDSDGNLLCFFPDTQGVAVAEAEGANAYGDIEGLDLYRRMLVMIPVSEEDAYVVDLFRVRGGSVHDWTVHGDADGDTIASASLALDGRRDNLLEPGEEWVEPTIIGNRFNPYGLVRDVHTGVTADGFRVDFRYMETPEKCLRIHMLPGEGDREVLLGQSPSVRRMGDATAADMRKAYDYWMPKLLVRATGEEPVSSVFTAVHEPFEGALFITSVERLELTPADDGAVALRVTHGDTTDTIISTLDEAPYVERATAGDISMSGRLGILRQVDGVATAAWLFEGERIGDADWVIEAPLAHHSGELREVMRSAEGAEHDAFAVDARLPSDGSLDGTWMIVTHGDGHTTRGFEIERVEPRDAGSLLILTDDPGLRIEGDSTLEVYHPKRSFEGANSFSIPLSSRALRHR